MRFLNSIYVLLCTYTIAALIFWEFKLQKQTGLLYHKDLMLLQTQVDSTKNPARYHQEVLELQHNLKLSTQQFEGEGATFLIVILIGAVVVYSSVRRRILVSRQQNNFTLSVTHELKSPVAAIKLNLQTLVKHQLNEDKRKVLLDRCINEANRLNDLCNNMLFVSQIEAGQYKAARELFDLSEMLTASVREYAVRYPRKFAEQISPGCNIAGDKIMLQMAFSNLLENAVKYTPPEKPIKVSLQRIKDQAVLQFADEGAGIPDHEKNKIFNKFYRVGNEETRKTKGTGLGLYLTLRIIRQHKGQILIKDNTPTGAIFEILLPLVND